MAVEIDLDDLRASVFRLAKEGLLRRKNPQKFIDEFYEIYQKDQREAVIVLLQEKLEQEEAVYGYLKVLLEIKFVDFLKPRLKKKLRQKGEIYLRQTMEGMEKAIATIKEQIALLESGEPIEANSKRAKK